MSSSEQLARRESIGKILDHIPETIFNFRPSRDVIRWLLITGERRDVSILPPTYDNSITIPLEQKKLTLPEYESKLGVIVAGFCDIFAERYKIKYPLTIEVNQTVLCNIIKDLETLPGDKVEFLHSVLESETGENKKQIMIFLTALFSIYPILREAASLNN
jgi:hypothetical protein